ncbi:hypothetical protein AB0L25_08215 [Spirillospora sp. NPDC052242]
MLEATTDADPHHTTAAPPADAPDASDPDPSHTGRDAARAQLLIALRTGAIVTAAVAALPLLPAPLAPAVPAALAAAALAHVRCAERTETPRPPRIRRRAFRWEPGVRAVDSR